MRKLLLGSLLLLCMPSLAQTFRLSTQAQFSLLTMGPDQGEFYEAFGHSAIRLVDPVNRIDYAYNYGVFSFNQPNFYVNFAKGHLNYCLAIQSYPEFREAYIYYNRYIHEQTLNLNQEQKQKIFDYLQWNAQPENKYYLYDYFFNNCSTKIRDLFAELLKADISFDQSFIKTDHTIRQLTDLYLDKQPWGDLGIDIGLGSRIDEKAKPYEYTFLPEYLELSFDHANIFSDGITRPLVGKNIKVFVSQPEDDAPGWLNPWIALGTVLFATTVVSWLDFKNRKLSKWLDAILLSVTGLLGVVLMLLWFATDHHACAKNYNLLWALPTNLIAAFLIFKRARPRWLSGYFMVAGIVALLILAFWFILPQQINKFLWPLILALAIRYFANWMLVRKIEWFGKNPVVLAET